MKVSLQVKKGSQNKNIHRRRQTQHCCGHEELNTVIKGGESRIQKHWLLSPPRPKFPTWDAHFIRGKARSLYTNRIREGKKKMGADDTEYQTSIRWFSNKRKLVFRWNSWVKNKPRMFNVEGTCNCLLSVVKDWDCCEEVVSCCQPEKWVFRH